jgi:hypothetical protein
MPPPTPSPRGTWDGEIVVCDRGTYFLVDKAANVQAAGAGGVIIANTSATGAQTYVTDLGIPGTHVTSANADLLRAGWWIARLTSTPPPSRLLLSLITPLGRYHE